MSHHLQGVTELLLVEDTAADAEMIERHLKRGYEGKVTHVYTLSQAVRLLQRGDARPDVILLDLRLPDAAGTEALARLRLEVPHIPVVVLTNTSDDEMALRCIADGAQDYVVKSSLRGNTLRRAISYAVTRERERTERARAEELHTRLAAIVEVTRDAIISTDANWIVRSWNRGAEEIFEIPAEEAVGRPVMEVVRPVDSEDAQRQEEWLKRARFETPIRTATDVTRLRSDGSVVHLSVIASHLLDGAGKVVGLAAVFRDETDRMIRENMVRAHTEEIRVRQQQLQALLERMNRLREDERARISREFHDQLGQLINGVKMNLRWLRRRMENGEPLSQAFIDRIEETEDLTMHTIREVQRIAHQLRPSALDALGLSCAVRDDARLTGKRAEIPVEVHVELDEDPRGETATHLFRIYQELVTNATRHASPTRIAVRLFRDDHDWALEVEDDGVGIPEERVLARESLGLIGIQERVRLMDGRFSIHARPEGGSAARVRIPYHRARL